MRKLEAKEKKKSKVDTAYIVKVVSINALNSYLLPLTNPFTFNLSFLILPDVISNNISILFSQNVLNSPLVPVTDSVNRGISTARRMRTACIIRLSINKNLKLRKRKGRDKQQYKKIYTIPNHVRVI